MLSNPYSSSSTDLSFFSASKSSNSIASSSAPVVTTRIVRRTASKHPQISYPRSGTSLPPSTPVSSPPSATKRKSSPLLEVELPRDVKRLRGCASSKPSRKTSANSSREASRVPSSTDSRPPSPEPIYRSRSRSCSTFAWDDDGPISRRDWMIREDGRPGEKHWSSEETVKRLIKSYRPYFKDPHNDRNYGFKPHPTNYPVAELEYPNTGAVERFILLAPKDKDHYNPIMDLENSLYTILNCYLSPKQRALFGTIPSATLSEAVSSPSSPSSSPSPSPPHFDPSDCSSNLDSSSPSPSPYSSSSNSPSVPLLRLLKRAINKEDGPLFIQTMERINELLRSLKYPPIPDDPFAPPPCNALMKTVEHWTETGIPKQVLMTIIEENYQRSVGPYVQTLKAYEAFSSTVYGELMPSLAYELIKITKLDENSLFMDLGSGVGNVCVQASLQSGCRSYGIEIQTAPAKIAREMKEHMETRCRMWGIRLGEIELEEGDMLKSARVDELIPKADVVLVDNKVFSQSLNEALRPKFLDLKEGAIVISLKPFVSSLNARVTERNVDDMSTIFDVTERPYHSGSVSWGNSGGSYYLHRVDRTGYAEIRERFENSRIGSGRSSRTKRP
ncbi:hypothetical protein H0H92_008721 [Tricholoma furcatifolium]|nr:hypothetical protein H0H92_008721 [Tricholoma furcatifolium]